MKIVINKKVTFLRGVSTLDLTIKNAGVILLLLIWITAFGGAVRGGHSTLDLVDPSFNPQIETTALGWKRVNQILPLPDGKILVVGRFNNYNGRPVSGLVRLNADGTLDTTFTCNLNYLYLSSAGMMIQADGKILIAIRDDDIEVYELLRLNSDGSLDQTFSPLKTSIWSMAIDASARIVVSGTFDGVAGIIRLHPDGSPDPTFQFPLNGIIYGLTTQNNKIIVESQEQGLQRLNEDGTIDSAFIQRNVIAGITVQPDNKILVWGSFGIQRLNENGSDDTGFTVSAIPVHRLDLGGNGKITVANRIDSSDYQIRRLLADGTTDNSFTPYLAARFICLAVQADGGVLIGDGDIVYPVTTQLNDFVRLFPNGSPDRTFNTGTGFQVIFSGSVAAIDVQPDQKILIGGNFQLVNDVPRVKIARLNADSTLDPSFQISTGGTANYFSQIWNFSNIRTQDDGKIVVSGDFDYVVNGVMKSNLVRLDSDGSIDPTFILGVPISSGTNPLVVFNDSKLLVGTSRLDPSQPPVPVKLLATGARDTSFNANLYPQDNPVYINDLAVQPDGRILIGGHRILPGGIFKSFLTRLNADGSLDTAFQTREQFNKVLTAFVLLTNGKIVIAETGNVLLLNPDGSVDPTFDAGTGADGSVSAMLSLPTGRIFVGGYFTNFNGQPRGNLVQLNEDGSVFAPVYKLNGAVSGLAIDGTGRVFVVGDFTTIIAGSSGGTRTYIAGLIDASANGTPFDFDGDHKTDISIFRPSVGEWWISRSSDSNVFSTVFGVDSDISAPGDFTGDGKADIAVFRPSTGFWYVLRSEDFSYLAFPFGSDGDIPMPADYDGDGKADPAVFRPSDSTWYISRSSDGQTTIAQFGAAGDQPVAADYDGDGKADIAIYRQNNGAEEWWIQRSSAGLFATVFGVTGDKAVPGDYTGDGKTDIAVWRPSDGNWFILRSEDLSYLAFPWGQAGDIPAPGDYDGDGKTDAAIFRPSSATWYINRTGGSGPLITNFGSQTDSPVPGAFVR